MPKTSEQRSQNRTWYHRHRDEQIVKMRRYRQSVKDRCFEAYGGYVCTCCKETEKTFLCLDHINNDGHKHRKEIGFRGGIGIYLWLIQNNFPPGFQVLCFNCNQSKRLNGGICAHQLSGKDNKEHIGHSFEQSGPGDTIINMRRPDGHAQLDEKYDKGMRTPWLGTIGHQDAGLVSPEVSDQGGSGHMDSGYSGTGGTGV
jgi:hypothetical protein